MATSAMPPPPPPPAPPGVQPPSPEPPILLPETKDENIPINYRRCRNCTYVKHSQHFLPKGKRTLLTVNCDECRNAAVVGSRSSVRRLFSLPTKPSSKHDLETPSPEGPRRLLPQPPARSVSATYGSLRRSPPASPTMARHGSALGGLLPTEPAPRETVSPRPRGIRRLPPRFHRRGQVTGYTLAEQRAHNRRLEIKRGHRVQRRNNEQPSPTPTSQELMSRSPTPDSPSHDDDPLDADNRQICSICELHFPLADFEVTFGESPRDYCRNCHDVLQQSQSPHSSEMNGPPQPSDSPYMSSEASTLRPPARSRGRPRRSLLGQSEHADQRREYLTVGDPVPYSIMIWMPIPSTRRSRPSQCLPRPT